MSADHGHTLGRTWFDVYHHRDEVVTKVVLGVTALALAAAAAKPIGEQIGKILSTKDCPYVGYVGGPEDWCPDAGSK